jgi:hypothetical protein
MRNKLASGLILLIALGTVAAAQNFLNVKEGLWEATVTRSGGGMPGMSEDTLGKMTPEQRAMVEQMMKQKGISMSGNAITVKSCVTKDSIAKGKAFAENRNNDSSCTHSVSKSSSSHMEMKFHCDGKNGSDTIDGTTVVDMIGSDSVKGTSHVVMSGKNGTKNMDSTFTSKYLGAACGDIK